MLTNHRFTVKLMETLAWREDVSSELPMGNNVRYIHTLPLVVRDVRERGRDIEGCIKQWFAFVKPNFEKVMEYHIDAHILC